MDNIQSTCHTNWAIPPWSFSRSKTRSPSQMPLPCAPPEAPWRRPRVPNKSWDQHGVVMIGRLRVGTKKKPETSNVLLGSPSFITFICLSKNSMIDIGHIGHTHTHKRRATATTRLWREVSIRQKNTKVTRVSNPCKPDCSFCLQVTESFAHFRQTKAALCGCL